MTIVPVSKRVTLLGLDGACLLRITGDVEVSTVPELRVALQAALTQCAWIIVDLSRAGTVESLGLRTLLAGSGAAQRHGGALVFAAPPLLLRRRLRASRQAVTVFDSVPQALSALSPEPAVVRHLRYGETRHT
ncbi:STAS domain-containing protein [Paractinoplanes hotanensis]|uniref:STAS domain-containing protein n=1 Tax=Paractinoplanes hotanensis TaxID=2906497 RepID=A0ABT0YCN6_9ACTN|nr:STAS domain-containing protein [Actinoplanes hotanensis]MCM4083812.1 STAS domain-containing protein [Actinoplanes hotanensis]